LHSARRIWKRRLSGCDLENLEFSIMGQQRIQDIPSEMIPQIYFEYLRKRRVGLLRQVLDHNFYDVSNMIFLAMQIGLISYDPAKFLNNEDDLFSVAKYFYQRNLIQEARPLLQHILNSTQNPQLKIEALFFLSMIYKRMGEYQRSSEFFQQLLKNQRDHAAAIEELAKYYEHKEKNYQAALELINGALEHIDVLEQLGKGSDLNDYKASFCYRRERLERRKSRQTFPDGEADGD
jgi:tetratricopeptide (TPR) repeat protein